MEPAIIVDLDLSDGKTWSVRQPVDGLTDTVLEALQNEIEYLRVENSELNVALDDDYQVALTCPVENTILGAKALKLSFQETSPQRAALYNIVATALATLAMLPSK